MSYVSPNDPLPRNSTDRPTEAQVQAERRGRNDFRAMVANAKFASVQVASPESFRGLGDGVVIDVRRSQAESHVANSRLVPQSPSYADEIKNAPTVLPLNVPVSEYSGCGVDVGNTALKPVRIAPRQLRVNMPPMMPLIQSARLEPATQRVGMGSWGDAQLTLPSPGVSGTCLLAIAALLGLGYAARKW